MTPPARPGRRRIAGPATVAARMVRVNVVNVVNMVGVVGVVSMVGVVNAVSPMVPTWGAKAVLPVRRGPTCRRRCGR